MKSFTLGIGDGTGNLFVQGSRDSIDRVRQFIDEIREKNAEIERLKESAKYDAFLMEKYRALITELVDALEGGDQTTMSSVYDSTDLPTRGCVNCDRKDAEIERLNACAHSWKIKAEDRASLITELAANLEFWSRHTASVKLIQRAREATKPQ